MASLGEDVEEGERSLVPGWRECPNAKGTDTVEKQGGSFLNT